MNAINVDRQTVIIIVTILFKICILFVIPAMTTNPHKQVIVDIISTMFKG